MTIAAIAGDGQMEWLAVGNVSGYIVRSAPPHRHEGALTRGGVVGWRMPSLHMRSARLDAGDLLIMATDGIRDGFVSSVEPILSPRIIASRILEENGRGYDDALVTGRPLRRRPTMNSQPQLDYATALRAYLKDPDESALEAAYELGRAALDNGTGVIDIIGAHAKAFGSILGTSQTTTLDAFDLLPGRVPRSPRDGPSWIHGGEPDPPDAQRGP